MNKVIVTGGAGFIGSNPCQELAERGKHVIILETTCPRGKRANAPNYGMGRLKHTK